ncbi:MAG: chemotaxis protein CheA, partial [Gluconacetobacter diazotrophicus]|nr:chemotaxis protein CheA [Gluconacetobacter diazotrophicus]
MDGMDAIRATFFLECEEQLAELEAGLMALQDGGASAAAPGDTINAVFRAVHSIKGGAGAFSLDGLVRFAHVFETALDDLRSGRLPVGATVIRVILRASDMLADLVRAARNGETPPEEPVSALSAELAALRPDASAAAVTRAAAAPAADDDMDGLDFQPIAATPEPPAERTWSLSLRPHRSLYAHGNETTNLLRELSRLGELLVTLDAAAIPDLADLDPEDAVLAWSMSLRTVRDETAIREVFEFVEEECDLAISRSPSPLASDATDGPPDSEDTIAALLRLALPETVPDRRSAPPAAEPAPERQAATTSEAAARPAAPPAAPDPSPGAATIRVGLDRVDRLINLVGELVITEAMVSQRVGEAGMARDSGIVAALEELQRLTREIQDSVMAIRAQPVRSVFGRMPRLLREVCAITGKPARLLMQGEATEVDKTVIEHLAEPLTHMIRNAVDHGLEDPERRHRSGKPAEGTIRLSASHRSGRIVIDVADDGGGIDRDRVRSIAIAKGLVAADAVMSEEEIDNLIFLPGFSTANAVSDLSGRGVGMDVVRRSVQALGGRISIASCPGRGSTFTLSLPLTLAVLDGMVIDVAGQTLIVPLAAMVETLRPRPGDVHGLGGTARVVAMRGRFIRLIDVGAVLGFRDRPIDPERGVALLVEGGNGERTLLLADAIRGQRQVV